VVAVGKDADLIGPTAVVRRVYPILGTADTLLNAGTASEMIRRGDMLLAAPFGRSTHVDVADAWVAVAAPDRFRLLRIKPDGTSVVSVMPGAEVPLAGAEVDRLRDSLRALAAEAGQPFIAEPMFAAGIQPEKRPPFDAVRIGPDGRALLREFEPLSRRSTVWWVVAPEGDFAGRVRLPERSEVLQVGLDEMLILRRDDFDVPSVDVVRVRWDALEDSSYDSGPFSSR